MFGRLGWYSHVLRVTRSTLLLWSVILWMPPLLPAQISVKITSPEGSDFDYFGESVSIDGDYAVIGSWLEDNDNGKDAGAARVYRRAGPGWEEEAVLLPADGEAGDQFGFSVYINGDYAFVGAPRDDNENGPFAGAVYMYKRSGTDWVETGRLIAPDGELEDRFGAAISSRGDRLIVGAPGASLGRGAAYVFHEVEGQWTFVNAVTGANGRVGDQFGSVVAIDGEYAIVGAGLHDHEGLSDAGNAYIYVFNGATWVEQTALGSPDAIPTGEFGRSVALTGPYAFVGAPGEDLAGDREIGAVYVYERNGTSWTQRAKLTAFDGEPGDAFGSSLSALGSYAVIGSRWHRNNQGEKSGAAYLFRLDNSVWVSEARLLAADGAVGDQFGSAVGFSNEQVIVGARWDDNEMGQDAGAAYIFPVGGSGVPSLLASVSSLDFGAEAIGEDQDLTLTVANNGTADLNIASVRIEGSDAVHYRLVTGGSGALLAPLASIDVAIEFRPQSPGVKTATLVIESNSPVSPDRIPLLGEGVEGLQPGVAQLLASRGDVATFFGSTVAVHGDFAIVGAEGQSSEEPGAAYIFRRTGEGWVQQSRLTALDGQPGDRFGSAVSISNTHALIGAWNHSDARGAAYVFIRSGSAWIEQAKLTASDGLPGDHFGRSVAIDGEFGVVGSWQDDNERGSGAGAAYVYRQSGVNWSQQVKLLAPDGEQGDRFGSAVEVEGNRVVVGAANGGFFGEGTAYVFSWQDPVWEPDGTLVPSDAGLSDGFGTTVAIEGDLAVVGAPIHDQSAAIDEGAAYVFQRALSGEWTLITKLEADDGSSGLMFGSSVALQGDEITVGAPGADNQRGAVYVFERSGDQWNPQGKLVPPGGQDGEAFGQALGYTGLDLIVGAPENTNVNGTDAGIVYLYARGQSAFSFESTLLATDRVIQPLFGSAVAIHDNLAVVGAEGQADDPGAAYVYERTPGGWAQVEELAASDGEAGDLFGRSVAISDDYIAVGAPGSDHPQGIDAGAVYIYLRGSQGWSEQARLVSSSVAAQDSFGAAVAIGREVLAVGAPYDDSSLGEDAGRVFIFTPNGQTWMERASIVAQDGRSGDHFGNPLAIDNTTLVVGAPQSGLLGNGAVYAFEGAGNQWRQEAKLEASDAASGDALGVSVDIYDNFIIAGASRHNNAKGAAYVFRRISGIWNSEEESKIESVDGDSNDLFGSAVALSEEYALVGAPLALNGLGAAYLFEREGSSTWLQQNRLQPGDEGGDLFGQDLDLEGTHALIGARFDSNGNGIEAGSVYLVSLDGTVSIVNNEDPISVPDHARLGQNYPNPARRSTVIPFSLVHPGRVRLAVFDLLGRQVAEVLDETRAAGSHAIPLDTAGWSSGTYFYRLETETGWQSRSLVVVK